MIRTTRQGLSKSCPGSVTDTCRSPTSMNTCPTSTIATRTRRRLLEAPLPGVDVHDERGERGDPGDFEGATARLVAMECGEQYEGDGGEREHCGAGVLP